MEDQVARTRPGAAFETFTAIPYFVERRCALLYVTFIVGLLGEYKLVLFFSLCLIWMPVLLFLSLRLSFFFFLFTFFTYFYR